MSDQYLNVRRVAVIGAGVSGVSAAIHLRRAGIDVTVYERSSRAGGVWVYNEQTAKEPAYPSTLPSIGDSPEYEDPRFTRIGRHDSVQGETPMLSNLREKKAKNTQDSLAQSFAPPGPAYVSLKNNVSTIEMELSCQSWKPGTEEFVPHHILAEYIQDASTANGVSDAFLFNTRVDNLERVDAGWKLDLSHLEGPENDRSVSTSTEVFDGVVIATGNYHACNVPDIPGLKAWKQAHPDRVMHSKLYRRPDEFAGMNVLLIGAGVSSTDIARDLGNVARAVFQSSRGGQYDVPAHILPDNAARIGGVASFGPISKGEDESQSVDSQPIPGTVILSSGQEICKIDHVIVCTGYHMSFPFMRQYHDDGVRAEDADERVLITTGQQTHNLHKDIWYIPDPTMAFIGVPYHTATFSLFEFQAMALAAVFSGKAPLPSQAMMRAEYQARLEHKGAGRTFHSLKGDGHELAYVRELVELVNGTGPTPDQAMKGHSQKFLKAYERRRTRLGALFGKERDPEVAARASNLLADC